MAGEPLTPSPYTDWPVVLVPTADLILPVFDPVDGYTKQLTLARLLGTVVAANDDTLAVTAVLHAGRVIQFGKTTGTVVTLPAATGSGARYTFIIGVAATSNANVIKVANGTDVMDGSLNFQQDTDVDGDVKVWRADAGDDTMSFAGAATTGGLAGDRIECLDYKAGFWSCVAYTRSGGGAEATPFSATV